MGNVTVRPLEWWEPDHTNNYTHGAKTIIGTYYVHIDGGRHIGCMETFVNDKIEQWEGPERGHLYEAQSDCLADYEARIRTALTVPCLQEPVGWFVKLLGRNGKTIWHDQADEESARAYAKFHSGTAVQLYAQSIEVREQAIRECAEIALSKANTHYMSQATAYAIERAILALLEGR